MEKNDIASSARGALERVCSGAGLEPPSRYYSPEFVDYVNDMRFLGLEGTRQSVALSQILSDIKIVAEEQLVEGDRVTSRFVVTGKNYGRKVRINGITISRFGMLRQLGLWRLILVGIRQWKMLNQQSLKQSRQLK